MPQLTCPRDHYLSVAPPRAFPFHVGLADVNSFRSSTVASKLVLGASWAARSSVRRQAMLVVMNLAGNQ